MNFKEFCEELSETEPERIVFVGLGNELRGDDKAGLLFLEKLQEQAEYRSSCFIKAGTNPENYLQKIVNCDADLVVFIDAARFGAEPGSIAFLNTGQIDKIAISTHAFSVTMIEDFLRSYKVYRFLYVGIEPRNTSFRPALTAEVRTAIETFFRN